MDDLVSVPFGLSLRMKFAEVGWLVPEGKHTLKKNVSGYVVWLTKLKSCLLLTSHSVTGLV